MITKQEFINQKIEELKILMFDTEPDLMTEEEEIVFRKFCEKFIEDLKEIAKNNGK